MRTSRSRARALRALLLLAVLVLPVMPLPGIEAGHNQSPDSDNLVRGLLPTDVAWNDWQASHELYVHEPAGDCPPPDPNAVSPPVAGDVKCQLPMNTTAPASGTVHHMLKRTTVQSDELGNNPANANIPATSKAWVRLAPPLTHPMHINGLKVRVYAEFEPPLTSCGLGPTGPVFGFFEVRLLPSGEAGESPGSGQLVGEVSNKQFCPVNENPGLVPPGAPTTAGVIWPIEAEIPVTGNSDLGSGYRLQLTVAFARPIAGTAAAPSTWTFDYGADQTASRLQVRSPDAFQFGAWMEDHNRRVTTNLPVPVNPADRFSAVGFFAFKTAFGGYDNPVVQSNPPHANDAKWRMRILAPNKQFVGLQNHTNWPDPPGSHEFKDCDNIASDTVTCLQQARTSADTPPSVRVFRMPDRPLVPGSSPVWNYTRADIDRIAPRGGEFQLVIEGAVRNVPINSRLPDGVKFTVGGFGVRLDAVRSLDDVEDLVHVVRPGQTTTFLLNLTNTASRPDNFTLSATFESQTPSGWTATFSGRDVRGQNLATLEGSNSTLLKVTLTPPPGAAGSAAATVKVRAQSQSASDQFAETRITAQVSSQVTRNVGVFVFPDAPQKMVRRGESATFNFTVWNRGTDQDSIEVHCDAGPDPSIDPATGRRLDESWNGTISLGGQTIGCRDANATRRLVVTVAPGDAVEARVRLTASTNLTGASSTDVQVMARSQSDRDKFDTFQATARRLLQSSFKLLILTEGTADPDDPQSTVSAKRTLRYGKDDPAACPNPAVPNPGGAADCSGPDENVTPFTEDWSAARTTNQRLDTDFAEFAFYRITIQNDGDQEETFRVKLGEVRNQTLDNCDGVNSFDAVAERLGGQDVGMGDTRGIMLLRRPVFGWNLRNDDPAQMAEDAQTGEKTIAAAPGRSAVFYLRVHHEWNRHNLSLISTEGSAIGAGRICDSRQTADVIVRSVNAPFPTATVRAETFAHNAAKDDPKFTKNVVVTQGNRCVLNSGSLNCQNQGEEVFDADSRQSCPPVTAADSPDRLYCKYVRPGQEQTWFFTVSKFWGEGDTFQVKPLRRVGGLSLADLKNRGWTFPPGDMPEVVENLKPVSLANATGDEIVLSVRVRVPSNATTSDFAGLELEVQGQRSGVSAKFSFFTIGAQRFKVNLTNLNPNAAEIHPGDRAAITLNLSNEGAAVDRYSLSLLSQLPQGWGVTFQPNETRVSASKNKTVTVFLQSPRDAPAPQTLTGTIRARSLVNLSEIRGETFDDESFTVVVKTRGTEDLSMAVAGAESRTIGSGTSLDPPFQVRITNPSPTEKTVAVRRLPDRALVDEFIDGWTDRLSVKCVRIPARATENVTFFITAAADALEGTSATYVVRADEFNGNLASCDAATSIPGSENFAQALMTVNVVGTVGVTAEAILQDLVVPRGASDEFPVRVRNFGTADDRFVFQTVFLNQAQTLEPNAWSARVRDSDGTVIQSLEIPAQSSRVVFVNVTAPLNIPQTGVTAPINLLVTASSQQVDPGSALLVARVQDYDIRTRVTNTTVDAFPGQTLFFILNMTNCGVRCGGVGNGIDTFDVLVDVGGLAGFWNVTTEFSAVRLLNDTSKDIQISVQVPRVRPTEAPTTGAVIGITVRSRGAEAIKPAAEELGAGNPLVQYLTGTPKTTLVTVNLFPYVSLDVDDDKELELAVDRNRNSADGFDFFTDPFTAIIQSVAILSADGDDDGRVDHFIDINLDGRPDRYWDPDQNRISTIFGGAGDRSGGRTYPDVNNDGTLEFLFDTDQDLAMDRWIDPATRRSGLVIEKDFDDDGDPEFLIDTDNDGRPDRYFDPGRGPRGLVTTVELAFGGNAQQYGVDTSGGGRPTKVYDRVTGEVSDARVFGMLEFVGSYWYLVLLFLAVAVLGGWLVWQRRARRPKA